MRQQFEQHFGHDFSRVRVHAGPAAAQSARDVEARAYTVGRDIVFGADQYAPHTPAGRHVLAHELTHFVQQDGAARGQAVARLQRFSLGDVIETGAEILIGPVGTQLVRPYKQFIKDLVASVQESPQHVMEFFENEVWEQIKAHWLRITLVTAGLILGEEVVAILTIIPEPTLLTKVVAAILQIVILAILGYFAAVEVRGAYDEGRRWLATVKQADGQAAAISEGSRAFVRMVWHIVMAVLAFAGVRARIRGLAAPRAGGAAGGAPPSSAGTSGAGAEGGDVVPISSHPRFQPRTGPPPPTQPSASAFGPGGTARQLAPAEAPLPQPAPDLPPPAPAPVTPAAASTTPGAGPGVQPVPAVAAGVSSAAKPTQRPPFVLRLPLEKAPHLGSYRNWLGILQSDPSYLRGRPAQLENWHQAHRIGGSHGIPAEVYERGHRLGLTGRAGEERIRVPDWTRGRRSVFLQVDHIIELQVTPASMRGIFDDVDNYELLDQTSNVASRNRLVGNIDRERAIQEAFDPSAKGRRLYFDRVELDGGQPGLRWTSEEIRRGDQLDAYSGPAPTAP